MSAANAARSIRNDVPTSRATLREQMRGNESLLEEYQAAEGTQESLVKPLSARQQTAINLLSLGKSVIATAKTIGVSESTLHRWKATHPLFKAELGRRQHDLFDGMVTRLRMSMSNAIDELNSILTGNRSDLRRDAMWQMLKLLKPQKYLVPDEPSTMQAVLDEQIRDERAQRGEIPEAPIDDEQRAAAIPAEYRVKEDVKHQGHEGDAGVTGCGERASRESHVEEASRQLRVGNGHVERSETSGPRERRASSNSAPSYARRESTPLPSREGPGEGAAVDEVIAVDRSAAGRDTLKSSHEKNRKPNHALPRSEPAIAPQPLPQGEGSQNATRPTDRQVAASESIDAPKGQILRSAQNDESAKERRLAPDESPDPPNSPDKPADSPTS